MTKELCIRCGKETEYDINYPVDFRLYYIEGSGQLCSDCFHILYPVPGALENKNCCDFEAKLSKKE